MKEISVNKDDIKILKEYDKVKREDKYALLSQELSSNTNGTNNSFTESLFAESDEEDNEIVSPMTATKRMKPMVLATENTKVRSEGTSTSEINAT